MKTSPILAGFLTLLLLSAGCRLGAVPGPSPSGPSPQPAAGQSLPSDAADVAARVNGQLVPMPVYQAQTEAALRAYYQLPGKSPDAQDAGLTEQALRTQVLDMLIDQVLIEQGAARASIAVDESEVTAEVERIRAQDPDGFAGWLAANGFTEESFRTQARTDLLVAAMRKRIAGTVGNTVEQVHLREILVATKPEAADLMAQLKSGAATFENLAKAHSLDEAGRANGGDVGFVPRGVLPQSVEDAAFGLEPGQVAGPVESAAGWHLVKLIERDPARQVAPELLARLQQESFARWLAGERAKAQIERYTN